MDQILKDLGIAPKFADVLKTKSINQGTFIKIMNSSGNTYGMREQIAKDTGLTRDQVLLICDRIKLEMKNDSLLAMSTMNSRFVQNGTPSKTPMTQTKPQIPQTPSSFRGSSSKRVAMLLKQPPNVQGKIQLNPNILSSAHQQQPQQHHLYSAASACSSALKSPPKQTLLNLPKREPLPRVSPFNMANTLEESKKEQPSPEAAETSLIQLNVAPTSEIEKQCEDDMRSPLVKTLLFPQEATTADSNMMQSSPSSSANEEEGNKVNTSTTTSQFKDITTNQIEMPSTKVDEQQIIESTYEVIIAQENAENVQTEQQVVQEENIEEQHIAECELEESKEIVVQPKKELTEEAVNERYQEKEEINEEEYTDKLKEKEESQIKEEVQQIPEQPLIEEYLPEEPLPSSQELEEQVLDQTCSEDSESLSSVTEDDIQMEEVEPVLNPQMPNIHEDSDHEEENDQLQLLTQMSDQKQSIVIKVPETIQQQPVIAPKVYAEIAIQCDPWIPPMQAVEISIQTEPPKKMLNKKLQVIPEKIDKARTVQLMPDDQLNNTSSPPRSQTKPAITSSGGCDSSLQKSSPPSLEHQKNVNVVFVPGFKPASPITQISVGTQLQQERQTHSQDKVLNPSLLPGKKPESLSQLILDSNVRVPLSPINFVKPILKKRPDQDLTPQNYPMLNNFLSKRVRFDPSVKDTTTLDKEVVRQPSSQGSSNKYVIINGKKRFLQPQVIESSSSSDEEDNIPYDDEAEEQEQSSSENEEQAVRKRDAKYMRKQVRDDSALEEQELSGGGYDEDEEDGEEEEEEDTFTSKAKGKCTKMRENWMKNLKNWMNDFNKKK